MIKSEILDALDSKKISDKRIIVGCINILKQEADFLLEQLDYDSIVEEICPDCNHNYHYQYDDTTGEEHLTCFYCGNSELIKEEK